MAIRRAWAAMLLLVGGCGGAPSAQAPTVELGGAAPAPEVSAAPSAVAVAPVAKPPPGPSAADISKELDQLDVAMIGVLGSGQGGVLTGTLQGGPGGGLQLGAPGGAASPGAATVKGPVVAVKVGQAAVVVGGDVGNVVAVAAGMGPGFRRCAQKSLNDDPTSVKSGAQARFHAQLGPQGEVTSVTLFQGGGIPRPLLLCYMARINAAQFAPPDGGGARVEIPFTVEVK
jgi:hypothetical protein